MGYMGLDSWGDSDTAADFHYNLEKCGMDVDKSLTVFSKELKYQSNCYNTPGPVNIALVVEDGILDNFNKSDRKQFRDVISQAIAKLNGMIDENKDDKDDNIVWHVTAYKRMVKSLMKFLKETE